jgi:hypothetical protein
MLKKMLGIFLLCSLFGLILYGCSKEDTTNSSVTNDDAMTNSSITYVDYFPLADAADIIDNQELELKENGSILQFYTGEETNIILEVRFSDSSFYEAEVGDGEYYTELPDIADKAAIAIPDAPYRITLLQGETSVMIQTIPTDSDMKLTEDQLIEVAKQVVSKLK